MRESLTLNMKCKAPFVLHARVLNAPGATPIWRLPPAADASATMIAQWASCSSLAQCEKD